MLPEFLVCGLFVWKKDLDQAGGCTGNRFLILADTALLLSA